MKTINDFGLSDEKIKELKEWALKQYKTCEKKNSNARCERMDVVPVQHFLNDFFVLNKRPWSTGVDLDNEY
jgi:hypothetical protein